MSNKFKLAIFSILFLCACQSSKESKNEIYKLAIASGYCHGDCPYQAIEINSNLKYKYFGGEHSQPKGYFTGVISQKDWDSLASQANKLDIKNLDSVFDQTVDDQSIEIIIHYSSSIKHINAQVKSLPNELKKLYNDILNTKNITNLNPSKNTLDFETKIQKNQIPTTMPKFPPKAITIPPTT